MDESDIKVLSEKISYMNEKLDTALQIVPMVHQIQLELERIKTRDDSRINNNNLALKIISLIGGIFMGIATSVGYVFYDAEKAQTRGIEETRERVHENALNYIRLEGRVNECVLKK